MSTSISDKMSNVKFFAKVNENNQKIDNTTILRMANQSDQRFAAETKCVTHIKTQDITAGTDSYPVVGTGTDYQEPVQIDEAWFYDGTNEVELKPKNSLRELKESTGFTKSGDSGTPPTYCYLERDSGELKLHLYPVPNRTYTNGLKIISRIVPKIKTDSENTEIPDQYSYIPDLLAASLLQVGDGSFTSDYKLEQRYLKEVERVQLEMEEKLNPDKMTYIEEDPEYGLLGEVIA